MDFNFITHIKTCSDFVANSNPVSLILYTHIPSVIVALLIGILVLGKNRTLLGRILFAITVFFSFWVIFSLVTWLSTNSILTLTVWSFFGLLTALISILSLYFFYVYAFKKDLSPYQKIWLFSPLLPIIILTPTTWNLANFDLVNCEAVENHYFDIYYYFIGGLAVVGILWLAIYGWKKVEPILKKQLVLMLTGLELFLIAFLSLSYIASYFDNFSIEFYGLLGMVVFMAFLAYMIVKFKSFDIKLLGAQALVWSLIILIGSLFVYMNQVPFSMLVIIAITLVISSIVGLMIVRGVKREVSLRESLEIANKGQENLIHIMNHQIKGFLGKARLIFAEFLEGDTFGRMPESVTPALQEGLRATTEGVNYVTEILRGANASKGTLVFDKKPMDVKVITEELIPEMQPLAKEWKVALEDTIAPGEYQIIGDRTQLKEAFKNLITNAIRYNDPDYEHKSVKVTLSRTNDKILFSVRDTGKGIAPEDRARLFTPGGVGKNSIKQNADATGFGLSFVKGCVLSHNGIVDYKSNSPERGTTFFSAGFQPR